MSDGRPPEAEFREYTRGQLPNQYEPSVHPWTGEINNPRVRAHLDAMARLYDPDSFDVDMPERFVDTEYCQHIRRKWGTESGTQAVITGNVGHLNFYSGLVGYEKDISGMQVLMSLQNMIRDVPVFIAYIYGLMGSGKTDFAFLLLETFASVYGRENVHMVANIDSDNINETTKRYSRVVEMLEDRRERIQSGEELDPIVIVVDEAAQIFSGSGADQHRAKQLAKLLKLARKSNAHIIMIGQDGKDVGPSLRALCTVFVHKESKKKASFYRDVKDREGQSKITSVSGVPPTNYDYDTYDEGEFVFDEGDDDEEDLPTWEDLEELKNQHEREMMAILDATTDKTQAEIGDVYDVSDKTVRRAKQKHENKLQDLGLA